MMPHRSLFLSGLLSRRLLAGGVSALTLLALVQPAEARNALARASQALGSASGSSATASAPQNALAQANAAAVQSRNALARANQALKAARDAQTAARLAAQQAASSVTNGLGAGGLNPGGGATIIVETGTVKGLNLLEADGDQWQGVSSVTQTAANGRTGVTVRQNNPKAVLTWQEFNVGRETTLAFDQQGNASWVALNKVEAGTAPSRILGTLKADGQVYVINRNGIVFGGASQVNVASLVASSLPINDALLDANILYSNPDRKFTFSAYSETEGTSTGAFKAPVATAQSQTSKVVVEQGAQIVAAGGGRILLVGSEVSNAGTISAANGQVILAAGQQVAVLPHDSEDAGLRGLDVYIGSVSAPVVGVDSPSVHTAASGVRTGTARNSGVIETERGNITMTGAEVQQNGILHATTSVAFNGRIDLLAGYGTTAVTNTSTGVISFIRKETGLVRLGADSLTDILPEYNSTEKVAGTELALKSRVDITGQAVYLGTNATILAPSGEVAVQAGTYDKTAMSGSTFLFNGGQIYLDTGASIQVFGSIVTGKATDNIIAVELRGAEFADSPLQRNGALHGQTVYVDIRRTGVREDGSIWIGTPLADVSGYVALIERSVGELTTDAGSITLNAGASVVMREGAWLDVSNGWVAYAPGYGRTTKLLGADGRVYDISQATPDREYVGIAGAFVREHARWNVTETWTSSLVNRAVHMPGYVHGGAGGSARLRAGALAFGGEVRGQVMSGERQREEEEKPTASSLELLLQVQVGTGQIYIAPAVSQDVLIGNAIPKPPITDFDPSDYTLDAATPISLDPSLLSESGVGRLTIDTGNGDIRVLSAITGPAYGELALTGRTVTFEADVILAGGGIRAEALPLPPINTGWTFPAQSTSGWEISAPAMIDGRGSVRVGESVTLSTAGLLVDDLNDSQLLPLAIDGGTIELIGLRMELAEGSILDVSGGGTIGSTGRQKGGKGGSLTIDTGAGNGVDPSWGLGRLVMRGELRGYGVLAAGAGSAAGGGSLTIVAPSVDGTVGGHSILIGGDEAPADPDALWLQPDFFSQGGFSRFTLTSTGRQEIAAGTVIDPVIRNYRLVLPVDAGSPLAVERMTLANPFMRSAFSLDFEAQTLKLGNNVHVLGSVTLGADAEIHARPTLGGVGLVSLQAYTALVLGLIDASGGSIVIASDASRDSDWFGRTTIDIGSASVLSVAGSTVSTYNPLGLDTGYVLDAGEIEIKGAFVIEHGAVLDVSGAFAELDTPAVGHGFGRGRGYTRLRVDGNAGALTLQGIGHSLTLGTLLGTAEGQGRRGMLTVSGQILGSSDRHEGVNLQIVQHLAADTDIKGGSTEVIGSRPESLTTTLSLFAADSFIDGGFGTLILDGGLRFSGLVAIEAGEAIHVAGTADGRSTTGALLEADAEVMLKAPYVRVGIFYDTILDPSQIVQSEVQPSHGAGVLTVEADELIDVGLLATQQIGQVNLITPHDVRGYGTLETVGEIAVTAGQVYPVTGTQFTLTARNPAGGTGSVRFRFSGVERSLPFSAGGTLNVFASTIQQDGVLRAPFGVINLGSLKSTVNNDYTVDPTKELTLGAGGVTSVSGVDPITGQGVTLPYGLTLEDGETWLDPNGVDITVNGPVQKTVNLSGDAVHVGEGALLDLSGGGDLYAAEWVSGLGGSKDILASSSSFAVLPSYQAAYAPLNRMATEEYVSGGSKPGAQSGWNTGGFTVGDRVWLDASEGLSAGWYTLLPARYALLPGAFLITPKKGEGLAGATVSVMRPDGSGVVSGYRANALTGAADLLPSLFEVASIEVVRERASYDVFSANEDLPEMAASLDAVPSRMPIDAGQLVFRATSAMSIRGTLRMDVPEGGRGGLVDIGSSSAIVITDTGSGGEAGLLSLSAADLSGFGAESLLIGGIRSNTSDGVAVEVTSAEVTLANRENVLSGAEIILVASDILTLEDDSAIAQRGELSGEAETLILGDEATSGSGNGALVRVSSDVGARVSRRSVTPGDSGDLMVGRARLSGAGVILDSTGSSDFDPAVRLQAEALTLGGGRISLQFEGAGPLRESGGIVLSNSVMAAIQAQVGRLALQSYSTIDFYGHGAIGTVDHESRPSVEKLGLSAAALRGFDTGGNAVIVNARTVSIDNLAGTVADGTTLRADDAASGRLVFNTERVEVGEGRFDISGYDEVDLKARQGMLFASEGGLSAQGDITVRAPAITAATAAEQSLAADSSLRVLPYEGGAAQVESGLGAKLTLAGSDVTIASLVYLPSGAITVKAAEGDITVGNGGELNAGGVAVVYSDQIRYTNAGSVALEAEEGAVAVEAGGTIDVSASPYAGDAGTLAVRATGERGAFILAGALRGAAASGAGGQFSLDVHGLALLGALNTALNQGGFTQGRSFRVRSGDVLVDGQNNHAKTFIVSADEGKITVAGRIDASGETGGRIELYGYHGVALENGAVLTVAADTFDSAGKGGSVLLEAGGTRLVGGALTAGPGWIDLAAGSLIDLSVAGGPGGTLHLRAPQITGVDGSGNPILSPTQKTFAAAGTANYGTDLAIKRIDGTIRNASSIVAEGFQVFDLTDNSGGQIDAKVRTTIDKNGKAFATNNWAGILARLGVFSNPALAGVFHLRPGAELAVRSGDITLPDSGTTGTGNWDLSTYRYGPLAGLSPGSGEPGMLTIRAPGNLILRASISDGFTRPDAAGYGWPYTDLGYYHKTGSKTDYPLWQYVLLPAGSQSWSYRLTAGADLGSVRHGDVLPLGNVADNSGSVRLGVPATQQDAVTGTAPTSLTMAEYQTIRTGTGDISIAAARDVKLLNQFATIYTAGSQVATGESNSISVASGGSLAFQGGVPVRLPGGETLAASESITITSEQDGVITRTLLIGAVDYERGGFDSGNYTLWDSDYWTYINTPLAAGVDSLPAGTVIVLPGGTEGLPRDSVQDSVTRIPDLDGMPVLVAQENRIVVASSTYGANISFDGAGTLDGIKAGVSVTLETFRTGDKKNASLANPNLSEYLQSTSGGVMTVIGDNSSVTIAFAAGRLPDASLPAGSTSISRISISFNEDAAISTLAGSGVVTSFSQVPAGTYVTSSTTGGTRVYLPPASAVTVLSSSGGIRVPETCDYGLCMADFPYIPVTIQQQLKAGQATRVESGSSITLAASGDVTFHHSSGGSVDVLTSGGSGTIYAFDQPNTAYALPLTDTEKAGINGNWFGSLGGYGNGGLYVPNYLPQWSDGGGNVTITAGNDIIHQTGSGLDDAQMQLPNNWLYRRSATEDGRFVAGGNGDMASTAWWVDFSNFFEGVGALGGGNVTLTAGRDVKNVDAVAPTNAWMPYQTLTLGADGSVVSIDDKAANQPLFEYGGGDVTVIAGRDINAGVYYVEKGDVTLEAGRDITTNERRSLTFANYVRRVSADPADWLPTQIMLGKGNVFVSAGNDVRIGAVTNPFLLTQGIQNSFYNRAYFLTYDADNQVEVSALTGSVTIEGYSEGTTGGSLWQYFTNILTLSENAVGDDSYRRTSPSYSRSWLRLAAVREDLTSSDQFEVATSLMPANLNLTAFSGDIDLVGAINLAPSANGSLSILASGSVNGYQRVGLHIASSPSQGSDYLAASINMSDIDPSLLPGITSPLDIYPDGFPRRLLASTAPSFGALNVLFDESGATRGAEASSLFRNNLHDPDILHFNDPEPVRVYAGEGDITGLTLYSPKRTELIAGRDIGDIALYLQNLNDTDISRVVAGRDIVAYNENTPARLAAGTATGNEKQSNTSRQKSSLSGDIFIGGPGTLEILAGRHLDLGGKTTLANQTSLDKAGGMALGVISIGNQRNPYLSGEGADIVMMAGIGGAGLENGSAALEAFAALYLDPANLADPALALEDQEGKVVKTYEAELLVWLIDRFGYTGTTDGALAYFNTLSLDQRGAFLWTVYFEELRQGGREYNNPDSRRYQSYLRGRQAIAALLPESEARGDIDLSQRRLVRSDAGGSIFMLAPGGAVTVGHTRGGEVNPLDEGIMTLRGGDISIYAKDSVEVGDSRIFTFQGGDILIWSNEGNIAAGHGSKTLQAAPPARFLIDPSTGAAIQDISGVATGSGIGTLQTLVDVPAGDVDLIAPAGYIDAGDAGIRVSGDINIIAQQVLNATNIQVQGSSTGVPVAASPNVGAITAASNAAGQATGAAESAARSSRQGGSHNNDLPSIITVEIIGYGGGDSPQGQQRRQGEERRQRPREEQHSFHDPDSPARHYVGAGPLSEEERKQQRAPGEQDMLAHHGRGRWTDSP